jgi:hypothetical protein
MRFFIRFEKTTKDGITTKCEVSGESNNSGLFDVCLSFVAFFITFVVCITLAQSLLKPKLEPRQQNYFNQDYEHIQA